ncbi:MAG: UDP-N-acetylmuramoyl-tripeptide--D-alanyl-D-alanine ligase [Pirellulales bacterium]|nr:UDP-N-acetylmuramoyl-tripeptide--D-alanyl-D-alanine ligase [Pirellulales bacterium]
MATLGELQKVTGGAWRPVVGDGWNPDAAPLGRIVTDSRQIEAGDVFWTLTGKNHDGAEFAAEAFERGAAGAVVSQSLDAPADRWLLTVADPQQALQQWAAWHRQKFSGTMIAVTGSVGKTTTRQMIHTVLGSRWRGTTSPRNFNNHIGVPLSILQIDPEDQYAVLELGASATGEIASLSGICQPRIGVITNVADAHLGSFGSPRAIAEAKAELLSALPLDGHAVLGDDPWLRRMARKSRAPITWVGRGTHCDITAGDVQCGRGELRFRVEDVDFRVPVWGRHHLPDILMAVAVGGLLGIELPEIAAALERFDPLPMRCEVIETRGATIINDTYNASPTAMKAALELLRDFDAPGRRIIVCGDMAELGDESVRLHRQLGNQVVSLCGADLLIACGQYARDVVAGARAAGMPPTRAIPCRTPEETLPFLGQVILPGDVVLVKGSRVMGMERLVEAMQRYPQRRSA